MHFTLVTPERTLFEEEVLSVTLPTKMGEITILPHHIPLVSHLTPGVAELTRKDGTVEDVALSGGFIQVNDHDQITVLADTAERGEELDLNAITQAKDRAEKLMNETVHDNEESFAMASAQLERELARYKTALKHKHRHSRGMNLPISE